MRYITAIGKYLLCCGALAGFGFGQSPADGKLVIQLPAPAIMSTLSTTQVTLIMTDTAVDGAKVITTLTGHLDLAKGIVWDSREVTALPKAGEAQPSEIEGLFSDNAAEPFARPVLRAALPGVDGAPLKALAFSGGGIKGLAYAGALKALEDAKLMPGIKRFSGASAGAITATLMAAGFTSTDLGTVLMAKNFGEFMDAPVDLPAFMKKIKDGEFDVTKDWWKVGMLVGEVYMNYGMCRGDKFEYWLEEMLHAKGLPYNATFQHFADRGMDLNIVLCDVSRGRVYIANAKTAKNTRVTDAVRISMGIPFVFRPKTSTVNGAQTFWVDGGTMYNYPVDLFDAESGYDPHSTMGFLLSSEASVRNPKAAEIKNVLDFTGAVAGALRAVETAHMLRAQDDKRTVFIDTEGVGALDFVLTEAQKTMLLKNGEDATRAYLKAHGYIK